MFCDDEPEALPWDYFLTNYERDVLALNIEELLKKYPQLTPERLKDDMGEMSRNSLISK